MGLRGWSCGGAKSWHSPGAAWDPAQIPFSCAAWNEGFAPGIMTVRSSARNCPHPAPLALLDVRSQHSPALKVSREMQLLLLYTTLDLFTSTSTSVAAGSPSHPTLLKDSSCKYQGPDMQNIFKYIAFISAIATNGNGVLHRNFIYQAT